MGKEKRENKRRTSARVQVARAPPIKKSEKQTMAIHFRSNEQVFYISSHIFVGHISIFWGTYN